MSDRDDSFDQQTLAREALSWIFRLRSGEMTTEDAAELMQWRARDPRHAQALSDAVKLRRRLVQAGHAIVGEEAAPARARATPGPRARSTGLGRRAFIGGAGAIAASAGAIALVRPPLGLWPSLAELRSDYRTHTGQRRTVEVAQGLAVELNTRTSLSRRDNAETYRLELIEGEVAVEAAHPARPVAIMTAAGQAVGHEGRFGVRLVDAGTCVTCLAGQVTVTDAVQGSTALAPGQQMTFDGRSPGRIVTADLVRTEAWRRGLLVFSGQPLSDVVEEINRYRPGKIILANGALGRFPITGTFQLARLDRAVSQIRDVANAGVTNLPGGIVLLS